MQKRLINSHTVFLSTLIVVPTLILIVYFTGIEQHRSLYLNSLISTTIISLVMLVFITSGLYNGWKLKDTIGKLKIKHKFEGPPNVEGLDGVGDFGTGDDIGGIIVAILLWIVVAIFASIILYYVAGVLWLSVLAVGSVLYWIVFRAFRLVFKKGAWCKGNIIRSFLTALAYTLLYNCWIYAIILGFHFLKK